MQIKNSRIIVHLKNIRIAMQVKTRLMMSSKKIYISANKNIRILKKQ